MARRAEPSETGYGHRSTDRPRTLGRCLWFSGRTASIAHDCVNCSVYTHRHAGDGDNHLSLDKWGYVETDGEMLTNVEGVYAVGDVRTKAYRQITTAVADGTIAAIAISKNLT